MVDHGDGQPTLKVIDFGIAKFTDDQWHEVGGDATRLGDLIGAPAYMSPEQGRGEVIDPRTDVFAVGAILFRLLTGTIVNASLNLRGSSVAEIISQIQQFDPVKPSKRLLQQPPGNRDQTARRAGLAKGPRLVSAIRGDLDWITLKAVQPNRVERYATAEDLADDMQRFLDHRPVVARAPTIAYRLRKQYEQRRATVLGSSAVIVTVLVAAILGGIGRWNRQQTKQATLGRVSKQVTSLVDQSDAARRRAGASEANAEAEFVTARTAIAKVESLLESYPSLVAEKQRFESVKSSLHQDLAAFSLVAALNDARERATQINAALTVSVRCDSLATSVHPDRIVRNAVPARSVQRCHRLPTTCPASTPRQPLGQSLFGHRACRRAHPAPAAAKSAIPDSRRGPSSQQHWGPHEPRRRACSSR